MAFNNGALLDIAMAHRGADWTKAADLANDLRVEVERQAIVVVDAGSALVMAAAIINTFRTYNTSREDIDRAATAGYALVLVLADKT